MSGGASGLGAATARALHARGADVTIADVNEEKGAALAAELGERARFVATDVTDEASVQAAVDAAPNLRISFACAGIGWAQRTVHPKHGAHTLQPFETVIKVNLIGTFNLLRLAGTKIAEAEPLEDGERGVHVQTASVAAFEGQIGQISYSASKGGVVAMTVPAARDLARSGSASTRSPRGCSTRRCSPPCPSPSARRSATPCRSPSASARPRSTRSSGATSSRTGCSTARPSAWTGP